MWIRQVTAQAFGPFKGESVDLAEGLTVIAGPNEAGKSSWHAAIYAGLCGMRRGKGRRVKEDEAFAARHAPWDGGPWEVTAVVRLADGRTIELSHDLGSQTSSSARDLDLGHDVSAETSLSAETTATASHCGSSQPISRALARTSSRSSRPPPSR